MYLLFNVTQKEEGHLLSRYISVSEQALTQALKTLIVIQ